MASPVTFEPPPALVPPVARCRFPELVVELIPLARRPHAVVKPCFDPAARRVVVGLALTEDVCLWHSLVARERLGAHLTRDLST